jgi:hypothetical protein
MRRQARLYSANRGHFGNLVVVSWPGNEGGPFLRLLDLRLDLINHNPTGLEWGHGGFDPAQLALAILADRPGNDETALPPPLSPQMVCCRQVWSQRPDFNLARGCASGGSNERRGRNPQCCRRRHQAGVGKSNPSETVCAARIVKDMQRRGCAL